MTFYIPTNASKDYLHNKIMCVSLNKCLVMVMKIDQQARDTADDRRRFA